jgi:hypothetical protein
MQNLDLTKWLEMVWHALTEPDEMKRGTLLHAAQVFLQEENQEPICALPGVSRQKRVA